jgi:SRSO17 transposase
VKVKRLMAAGIGAIWAAADEVYGRCREFRAALRELSLAYVVIVPCDQRVIVAMDKVIRADQAVRGAVFERRSWDEGAPLRPTGPWPRPPIPGSSC